MIRPRGYNDVFVTLRVDVDNLERLQQGITCSKLQLTPVVGGRPNPYMLGLYIETDEPAVPHAIFVNNDEGGFHV